MKIFTWGLVVAAFVACKPASVDSQAEGDNNVLSQLPVNVDQNCMGLSLVGTALQQAQLLPEDTTMTALEVAQLVFKDAIKPGGPGAILTISPNIRYPSPQQPGVDIIARYNDPLAIEAMSRIVSNWYKGAYTGLYKCDPKAATAIPAANKYPNADAVRTDLQNDPDHNIAIAGTGFNTAPNGSKTPTNHMWILCASDDLTQLTVYDPSAAEPTKIACSLAPDGKITWQCTYRGKDPALQGQIITRCYQPMRVGPLLSQTMLEAKKRADAAQAAAAQAPAGQPQGVPAQR